jgi:hypothetical protein
MEFEYTRRQVARGARADAETHDKIHILKSAADLRATYQIRLLLYRALQEGKKLVLNIRQECKLHDDLKVLVKEHRKSIDVVRR